MAQRDWSERMQQLFPHSMDLFSGFCWISMQNLHRPGNTRSPLMLPRIHASSRRTSPDENKHFHFRNAGSLLTGGLVPKSYERWITSRSYSSFISKWGLSSGFGGMWRKLEHFFLYDLLATKHESAMFAVSPGGAAELCGGLRGAGLSRNR